jgi:beta-glucosidase-like glycosyl hydrolase
MKIKEIVSSLLIVVATASPLAAKLLSPSLHPGPPIPYPNSYFWGCLKGNVSANFPFCDHTLPLQGRVQDLLGRLTLTEKLGMLGPNTNGSHVGSCSDMDAGVARLGIPPYTHLVETNSGAGSECLAENKCATNFPGPTGLAASFNRTLWRLKGEVISSEQRAQNNVGGSRGYEPPYSKIGLTAFGPNVNIARDPRFGRISELPGEDPYLTGQYAIAMVRGMQEGKDYPKYLKLAAALKHFTAYSTETNRLTANFNISTFDLFDTYLRQYSAAFQEGRATAAMCSYASVNGVPMCANDYLLNTIVRKHWNRPDVHFQSDCGAIANLLKDEVHYAKNNSDAATKALLGGCDLDDGNQFYSPRADGGNGGLPDAIQAGRVSEKDVDAALGRVLTNERFRTGQADPLELQSYVNIGAEAINSTEHQQINLEAASQSFVLLKNAEGAIDAKKKMLPLLPSASVAIVGPHAVTKADLLSDYPIDQLCFQGPIRGGACWPSIGEAFSTHHTRAKVLVEQGVAMASTDRSGVETAIAAANASDVVILCLGLGKKQEHEGIDRKTTLLPGIQTQFATEVLALGKPTVIVLVNGGIVSLGADVVDKARAIVEAFYPSVRGAEALYRSLLGIDNKWGKLPVTIYDAEFISDVALDSFDMAARPGRTYRYYIGTPMWPFGFGLSLTEFDTQCVVVKALDQDELALHVSCAVKNIGEFDGDEILLVYHRTGTDIKASYPLPRKVLVDFQRISVAPGKTEMVDFVLEKEDLAVTTGEGDRVVLAGTHFYDVGSVSLPVNVSSGRAMVLEEVPRA